MESLSAIEPFSSVVVKGVVSQSPRLVPLRHVIFSIKDESAEVDCAAYEPTGSLRRIPRELMVGDSVEVYGAVRKATASKPLTINLEKIKILSLSRKITFENPFCPSCGKRLKSMGKHQGFRCEKCGGKFSDLVKKEVVATRGINEVLYVTSPRSQRHLTKPLRRYGQEKQRTPNLELISGWHLP